MRECTQDWMGRADMGLTALLSSAPKSAAALLYFLNAGKRTCAIVLFIPDRQLVGCH